MINMLKDQSHCQVGKHALFEDLMEYRVPANCSLFKTVEISHGCTSALLLEIPFNNTLSDLVGKSDAKYSRHMTALLAHLGYWNNFTWTDDIVWALVG